MNKQTLLVMICSVATLIAAPNGRYQKKTTYVNQQNVETQDTGEMSTNTSVNEQTYSSDSQTSSSPSVSKSAAVPPSMPGSYRGVVVTTTARPEVGPPAHQPPPPSPVVVPVG